MSKSATMNQIAERAKCPPARSRMSGVPFITAGSLKLFRSDATTAILAGCKIDDTSVFFQATANGASFNNSAQLQVPMTLLTAKKPMPPYFTPNKMEAWLRMHEEFAKKIPRIQHIVTDRSTDMVPVEQPELVVDAIRHENRVAQVGCESLSPYVDMRRVILCDFTAIVVDSL